MAIFYNNIFITIRDHMTLSPVMIDTGCYSAYANWRTMSPGSVLLQCPHHRWENWGSLGLRNLFTITLLIHSDQLLRRQRSGGSWFKASLRQIVWETLFRKYPTHKKAGRVAQVQQVECQPSKHEDLSSNPSTTKGRKKKKLGASGSRL
jgi:hypothetical protein